MSSANDVVAPKITEAYDEQLTQRTRAVRVPAGAKRTLELAVRDDDGDPVDLTGYGFPGSGSSESSSSGSSNETVQVRYREPTMIDPRVFVAQGSVVDAENGLVQAVIPDAEVMAVPGVYLAEVGVLDAEESLLLHDECYVFNEFSSWVAAGKLQSNSLGPPPLRRIRLSLRDSDPFVNELIENHDFDLAEICHAAVRVVDLWNEMPPPVNMARRTTQTFELHEYWLEGIRFFLFEIAEEHYRRNRLKFAASNLTLDDKNRMVEYQQAKGEQYARWYKRLQQRKVDINARQAYSSNRTGYSLNYVSAFR